MNVEDAEDLTPEEMAALSVQLAGASEVLLPLARACVDGGKWPLEVVTWLEVVRDMLGGYASRNGATGSAETEPGACAALLVHLASVYVDEGWPIEVSAWLIMVREISARGDRVALQ